jgi:hypothetical protein
MRPDRSTPRFAFAFVVAALVAGSPPAFAQTFPLALDVVGAVDGVQGSTPARNSMVFLDVFGAVRLAEGLDFIARPVISRRSFDGTWQKQMYQLGLRYERPASGARGVGLRFEVGQLPSPIGIAMLENRPDLNPLVSQHSAYYMTLPRVDPALPRLFLIGGTYPFGGVATVSARRWDARVALLDSSPIRGRGFFGSNKPPRLLNTVAGFGVTPRVGLRFGAAVAQGAYASVEEFTNRPPDDRDATMVQVEGEWSFGYTRIVGEWVKSVFQTTRADSKTQGYWFEATQTLSPRLFVAGRFDYQHYDYQRPNLRFERQTYERLEGVLGVRLSPDVTLRGGYMGRHGYVVTHWDDQWIASAVWQRKIW